jgi:hypothetical protein
MVKSDSISAHFDKERHHYYENPWTNQSFKITYDEIEELAINNFDDETPVEDMDDDTFNKYCEIIVSNYMNEQDYGRDW